MELIFLDFRNLNVKDYAYLSDDFNIILDTVLYQKSYFIVNKININVEVGDIVFLKSKRHLYLGIVETVSTEGINQTKIEANDFSSIFDTQVKVKSFSGDLCMYLKGLIEDTFVNNSDDKQNLSYLNVMKSNSVNGSLEFKDSELKTITEIASALSKSYGIRFDYELIIEEGIITGVTVYIKSVTRGLIIKSDLACISQLVITDSKTQVTNKVTYYPKDDNAINKTTYHYYLLTDGTITNDKNHSNRYSYVKGVSYFYSDNEYASLKTKAENELLKSNMEHNITFTIRSNNQILIPFQTLKLGDFVEFQAFKKTYATMVTQMSFKGKFSECVVTLGEYRVRLTEKIKLLSRK